MTRAVYPFALCMTLGLLATMWLRPGLAQDWIELASRVRLQSPDNGSSYAGAPSSAMPTVDAQPQTPFGGYGQPPIAPVPASRPIEWPATQPAAQGQVAPTGPTSGPPASANPGVMVWDPTGNASPAGVSQPAPPGSAPPNFAAPTGQPFPAQPSVPNPHWAQSQVQPPLNAPAPPPNANPNVQPLPPAGATVAPVTTPGINAPNLQVWPTLAQDLPDAQVAAKIGDQTVLVGDLKAMVADHLHRNDIEIPEEQREQFMTQACRHMLKQLIETKMIYNDALRTIPKDALPKIEGDLNGEFDKNVLPKLMESHNAMSVPDLDRKIRQRGSSLEFMRRCNFEKNFATGWLQQKVNFKVEIPISDVLGYYRSHLADYEFPAKARWEEIMVRFDRFPDRASAEAAIVQMGNAVQQGRPFADVARAGSHGGTASDGGQWDWTTKGSLTATVLDDAIFGLPVGTLSQILESDRGLHIVRVVERTEAGRQSFMDVQPDIKKQLRQERIQKQVQDYLEQIRDETPVWTMYDNEPGGIDGVQAQERRSVFE